MDDDRESRAGLLGALSRERDYPVLAICSGSGGFNVTNLGEDGVRAFVEILEREVDDDASRVGLFLLGEGGYPSFADGVTRSLRERGLEVEVIVPYRVSGVFTTMALSADRVIMHPNASVGAFDQPPLGRRVVDVTIATLEYFDQLPEVGHTLEDRAPELARDRFFARLHRRVVERVVGDLDSGVGARVVRELSLDSLGEELAVGATELETIGLACETAEDQFRESIWELFEVYEDIFEMRDKQEPLFHESDVADEVEFEPARGLVGAVIEGPDEALVFELDTGRPDPDTGMLDGEWLWSDLDA